MGKDARINCTDKPTCLSQGWEAKRAGLPCTDNPFELGSWQYEGWEAGWLRFSEPKPAKRRSKHTRRNDES